jgi:outer membrane protein OmpA-like peptidoglycan-associated protein
MMRYCLPVVLVLVLLCTASCASQKKNVFVLLPGDNGKTGAITVTSKEGTQLLNEPYQSVEVSSAEGKPSSPEKLNNDDIKKEFGQALSALPPPPIHFVLYFKFDSTTPLERSQILLKQILPTMVARKSTDVSVIGHTDRVGTCEYNFKLGMKRAQMAAKILEAEGIEKQYISISSHGENNPLIPTEDGVHEWRNRRVEVIVR